jgi:hypothetical protein
LIEDNGSTNGTWLHPKTKNQNVIGLNSMPMMIRDKMIIKISTFMFQFLKENEPD